MPKRKTTLADIMSVFSETIATQKGLDASSDPTPTELFAVISITLASGATVEHLPKVLKIFSVVLPQTAISILRSQFEPTSRILGHVIKGFPDDAHMLSIAVDCVGSLLMAQEISEGQWAASQMLKVVNALLIFLSDPRIVLRKAATSKLVSLLSLHKSAGCRSLRTYVSEFCIEVLNSCTRSEYKRSLFVVLLLEDALPLMPENMIIKICLSSLKLQQCKLPLLTSAVFRTFDSLFQSPAREMSIDTCQRLLQLLVTAVTDSADMESDVFRVNAMTSGIIALEALDHDRAVACLSDVTDAIVRGCDTDFAQIHCAVSNSLKRILRACVDKNMVATSVANRSSSTPLNAFINSASSLLHIKYQNTWTYILDLVSFLFESFQNDTAAALLGESFVVKLAAIYEAYLAGQFLLSEEVVQLVLKTLGDALASMGVTRFVSIVPFALGSTPRHMGVDQSRAYLLPLLSTNMKRVRCQIADFGRCILPVASVCSTYARAGQGALPKAQLKAVKRHVSDLWLLLPAICSAGPTDIEASFSKLVPTLEAAIKDPELTFVVLSSLGALAASLGDNFGSLLFPAAVPPDVAVLRTYAPTVFPLVLGIVDGLAIGDTNFQTCMRCICAWAPLATGQMVTAIANKLLKQLLMSTGSLDDHALNNRSAVWLSILLGLLPYLSEATVVMLYRTIRPLLVIGDSVSLQKRAYQVLDALLTARGDLVYSVESRLDLLGVLRDSLLTCHVSSRHTRLRCMSSLLESIASPEEMETAASLLIGEILVCQKDNNAKTREVAADVLQRLLTCVCPGNMFNLLCSGLAGETSAMRSSAIFGISVLLLEQRENSELIAGACALLPTVCMLFQEESVEQTRAILGMLRVCANVMSHEALLDCSLIIVPAVLSGLGQLKTKFPSRVRAIVRKMVKRLGGSDHIRSLMPPADLPLLDYIEKQNRRGARKTELGRQSVVDRMLGSDSDSGSDSGDEQAHVAEDYRLTERPKAIRAQGLHAWADDENGSFEDSGGVKQFEMASRRKVRARKTKDVSMKDEEEVAMGDEDDDDDYDVTISPTGQVVLVKKEAHLVVAAQAPVEIVSEKEGAAVKINKRQRDPGSEYRSSKAGGDVWKSGMLEPHAYIPLDARLLSKKNTQNAVMHFGSVVSSAKKRDEQPQAKRSRHGQLIIPGNRKQRLAKAKNSAGGGKGGKR